MIRTAANVAPPALPMLPNHAGNFHATFERAGIPLLLAGGWAVNHHGYSRMTRDVDWVCSLAKEKEACELMKSLGFTKTSIGMASRFIKIHNLAFPPVDLIWVDQDTFVKMDETSCRSGPDKAIPVVGFETLLAMKFHALKDDKHRQGRDVLDIRSLLKYNPDRLPEGRLRELSERYAGPGIYESHIQPYL
jgi:hypothetical protein